MEDLVAYAYARVPHYRCVMRQRKLTPNDVRTVRDLSKLPILTKEHLRAAPGSFRAEGVSSKELEFRHTSGTTGKALQFYVHRRATPFQLAVWWRHRSRFGLRLGDQHANFTGKMIVPPEELSPSGSHCQSRMLQAGRVRIPRSSLPLPGQRLRCSIRILTPLVRASVYGGTAA